MNHQNTLEYAQSMDEQDPLKQFRKKFFIPQKKGKDTIYFTGNSLGLQPRSTRDYMDRELKVWAEKAVEGHFDGDDPWYSYHEKLSRQLCPIVGAQANEISVMSQLTVNLHLLLASFYRPDQKRFKIICEAKAFPSDQYALDSQVRLHGLDPRQVIIEVKPRSGEQTLHINDIVSTIKENADELSLVLFGGINYYTGQVMPMKAIAEAAHKAGAFAGFDLAHAAGNIELHLHDWKVDFACWCSYKYLNSGPGGIAGIYIHEKHAVNTQLPRLAGWWGYEKETRFEMKPIFQPIASADGWQLSNGPVLLLAAHRAALEIFQEAGMERLLRKTKLLTGYLFYLLNEINGDQKQKRIELITPQGENEHGCQVSMFMLEKGKQIFEALTEAGVVADWREPNVIRVAPVPLYNTFEDVWRFGSIIKNILNEKAVPLKEGV